MVQGKEYGAGKEGGYVMTDQFHMGGRPVEAARDGERLLVGEVQEERGGATVGDYHPNPG